VLAPVLARLDAIAGVAVSWVDASGQFFALELGAGADPAGIARRARDVLGSEACVLTPAEGVVQLSGVARGDRWFSQGEALALSLLEARVLSTRVAAAAAREVPAATKLRGRLGEALRIELVTVLERVHREGGREHSGWIDAVWPEITRAAVARCKDALDADAIAALGSCLLRLLRP